jgi:serine protease Do
MYERNRRNGFWGMVITSLLTSIGVGILLFYLMAGYFQKLNDSGTPNVQSPVQTPQPQQIAIETQTTSPITAIVAKMATPGVVGISVLRVDGNSIFERNVAEKWGVGSGVIVSSDGYILTNNHVAGGKSKRIIVSLADGRNVEGRTLWSEPILDLAVVKVNITGLTPIPFGDAKELQVGEHAIAIGNPLGLMFQRTVTSGIVSALNRTIKIETEQGPNYMEDLIQTDASINPGNSGGPLLNSKGQVIGINTVKVTSAEAIGFAIPINVAVPIIKQFIDKGEFIEPYMGIFAYDKEIIPYVNNEISVDSGIYVANVDESGPAFKNGIKVGCIIKQVDGVDIDTMLELRTYLYSKSPGEIINVTHRSESDGKTVTVPIRLAAKERDGLITR